jgi:hypothetical protein
MNEQTFIAEVGNRRPSALDEVESTEARWLRINGGLEWLEKLAQKEPNPIRREVIYNVLAEAHCLS